MSASITVNESAILVDVPKPLFQTRTSDSWAGTIRGYAVTVDGQRFLVTSQPQGELTRPAPLTVVLNWPKLLKPRF
jgi:hypothetical protein